MHKFRVDTWGYSSKEIAIFSNSAFVKAVGFEENELSRSGMQWEYDMYGSPDALYSDSSKELIKSRVAPEIQKYASENNILTYSVSYPWETVEVKAPCWCGNDSVKSNRHSEYCPKYEKV